MPMLIAQNAIRSQRSCQRTSGCIARKQKSINPQAERAVNAIQRPVGMDSGSIEPLHIVKGDRRIDHKSEDARADQVPERDGHEKVNHPFVLLCRVYRTHAVVARSLDRQGSLPLRALSLSTVNGVLQGTYHSALTHDDDRNSLSKKVYWTRGSVAGGPCVNVGVRMGSHLLADEHVCLRIGARGARL